jgi:hypothetical protein
MSVFAATLDTHLPWEISMKNLATSIAVLAVFLMASTSLLAHHGTGTSYDMHKVVVLKGVVLQFNFANPHSQLYFDVKDDGGKVTHWSAEMRNPRNLESFGYTKKFLSDKFAPGATIEITGNPSKAGRLCWCLARPSQPMAGACATTRAVWAAMRPVWLAKVWSN